MKRIAWMVFMVSVSAGFRASTPSRWRIAPPGEPSSQFSSAESQAIARTGDVTVLFVSHSLANVKLLCGRCVWFDSGQVRMDGGTEADYWQEKLDRLLLDLLRDHQALIPFGERYPEIREITYGPRRAGKEGKA